MDELQKRAMQAEKIMAAPSDYKVCEGCGSILRVGAAICPVCKAYRFDESTEAVIEQAKILGAREARTISDEDW